MRDLLPDLSAFTPARVPALGWASDGVPRGEDAPGDERPPVEASGFLKIDPSLARYGVLPTPRADVFWAEGATELEVRCFGRDDVSMQGDVWLRAFRPPGFELLAAAPLVVDAGTPPAGGRLALVGRLELPPGLKEHQLELDITAAPAVPPRGSRMWTVLRATAAGQAALAAERSGWFDTAADLWDASAGNWEQAGELFQQVRAKAFKAQALDALTGRSTDELREELARMLPAAAWRLGEPRPHATAFLAEMARPAPY
jgi:hypothetical protein